MSAERQLALIWGAVALALMALAPLAPDSAEGLAGCPVKSIAGVPCPTCGATRATLALTDLAPIQALLWNPAVTLAWVGFLGAGLWAAGRSVLDRPLPGLPRRLSPGLRAAVALGLVANWIYLLNAGV